MQQNMAQPPPVQLLISHLTNTLSHDRKLRTEAEEYLGENSKNPRFGPYLLQLLSTDKIEGTPIGESVQISTAIYLKNFLKKYYACEEKIIGEEDRQSIKESIVPIMLQSRATIQKQLSECITLIAATDFYQNWGDLLPSLVQKLKENNIPQYVGVLSILESITSRYPSKEKTVPLVDEIKYIMSQFQNTWLGCLGVWSEQICKVLGNNVSPNIAQQMNPNEKQTLLLLIEAIEKLVLIFYHLISIDFIAFFEETRDKWMGIFRSLLRLQDIDGFFPRSGDTPTTLDRVRTNVIKSVRLCVSNWEEECQPYVPAFLEVTRILLGTLGNAEQYDTLVAESIQFLTVVSRQKWHRDLFNKAEVLRGIVQAVLVKNIMLRESDINMYEMNGEEWVRRDMEGSDLYTRRRGAIEFVRGLSEHFEKQISDIILSCCQSLTAEYAQNKQKNFRQMDVAINLILAVSVKGSTKLHGATKLNQHINVMQFFAQFVLPELNKPTDTHDIIRADALKFVVCFRSQWQRDTFLGLLELACRLLTKEDYVLHTYAAIAIDKVLAMKVEGSKPTPNQSGNRTTYKYPKEELLKHVEPVLSSLFGAISKFEESHNNEHVMRSILRVVQRAEEGTIKAIQPILTSIKHILLRLAKNPQKPTFYHYMFEVIAASIHYICRKDATKVESFEKDLMPTFIEILGMDTCTEFHPYVYQLIGLLLRMRKSMSESFSQLYDRLLHPDLWRSDGTILAISGIFPDYLEKVDCSKFVTQKRLEGMLGIFQALLSKRTQDFYAFRILKTIFHFMSFQQIDGYLVQILKLVFTRLRNQKSTQLCSSFITCLSLFVIRHGVAPLIKAADAIQKDILSMVVGSIYLNFARKVNDLNDRKILTVGMIRMITDPAFTSNPVLFKHFPAMVQKIIEVFEIDPESLAKDSAEAKEFYIAELEDQGFGAKFSGLSYAKSKPINPGAKLGDPRQILATAIAQTKSVDSQQLAAALQPAHVKALNGYCQKFKVNFQLQM